MLIGYAIAQVGYVGVVASHFESWGGIQVLVDLVIACGLAAVCMIIDARKRGVNPWGYVVLTLFLGSIGPLSYLLVREWGRDSASINKLQGHSV